MHATSESRSLLRSVGAVIAGALVGILLSIGTDALLQAVGILPPVGQPATSPILLLATAYRTVYGVLGSYITARLAPNRPMMHALVLGFMGLAANLFGAVTTWNRAAEFGPHWYPIALIVLALPTAWAGAKICIEQHRNATALSRST